MITLVVYVRRIPSITREQFSDYWFNHHGPLVMSVPEFMRHVRKYTQYHIAPGSADEGSLFGEVSDFDGVGEIWFESREAMNAALTEPRYLEIIRPDEARFVDYDGCVSFVGEERVMFNAIG